MKKQKLIIIIPVLIVALLAFVFVTYSPPADAKPGITWNPSSLSEELEAGQSTTTTVTFTSGSSVRNVTVEVDPEIAPYVSVSPDSFNTLASGTSYDIDVSFTATGDATVGEYEGTIYIQQRKRTLSKQLPVELEIIGGQEVFDNIDIAIEYPSDWYAFPSEDVVAFSNLEYFPSSRDDTYAYFQIRRLVNVNPLHTSIDQWFDEYFSLGFPSGISSKEIIIVDDRESIRVQTLGVGEYVNIYIPDASDVISISFSIDSSNYLNDYDSMLDTLSIME